MENNNQASSGAALTQIELQAAQSGITTTSLRRPIRLQNIAALKTRSPPKKTNRPTTFCNRTSDRYKIKYERRKNRASLIKLPDDMLINILSRVSPKSFFRCKKVSKTLFTLSKEAFRLNKFFRPSVSGVYHEIINWQAKLRIRYAEVSGVASQEVDRDLRGLPLSSSDTSKIVDCCGGLLLLQASNVEVPNKRLYVYNPATYNILAAWSIPPRRKSWSFYEYYSLAFDPRVPSQFYIVCFRGWNNDETDLNFFQTFSSKTGKWRSQKSLGSNCRINGWHNGTFSGGKVCRLANLNRVLFIDPGTNSFQLIMLPDNEYSFRRQLAQSQGYLHYIAAVSHTLQIWFLDNQQQWVQKHQLTYDQVYGVPHYALLNYELFFSSVNFENPMALDPEEDILYVPSASGKLMSYDMRTQRRRQLSNLPRNSLLVFWVYTPCYMA